MSALNSKKLKERFLLERFLDASGITAEIVEEREEPDFLIRTQGRIVGVEVTQVFVSHEAHGSVAQAQESISDRIVASARRMYECLGGSPVHVSVLFSLRDLSEVDRDNVAAQIANLVLGFDLSVESRLVWRPEEVEPLDLAVSYINALAVPSWDLAHWNVPRAGWVAPMTPEHLQARVDEKANRLDAYRAQASEMWLVIVADGTKPSQLFDVRSNFDPKLIASPFSRTYFYAHPDRAVYELGNA